MSVPTIPTIPTLGHRRGGVTVAAGVIPAPAGTPGTPAYNAASVVEPTVLAPDTGSGYSIGDVILCFTFCFIKTATVATPANWTKIGEAVGTTAFKLALFAKVAASTTETAPDVSWSGLTTGASGTLTGAQCQAFSGLDTSDIATIADVVGTSSTATSSAVVCAGGATMVTTLNRSLIIKMGARGSNSATTWALANYTMLAANPGLGPTTSGGLSMGAQWAYRIKTVAGSEGASNFVIAAGTANSSSGWIVALKAVP